MSAENWHEERERLTRLLKAIKSGEITHIDQEDLRELQATNPQNIAALEERLSKLNVRLGRT
jgi:predicted nucleotidyltransferase